MGNFFELTNVGDKFRKLSNRARPVVKRVLKGVAIIGVSLTINSLGAVADETCKQAGVAVKAAKSAKSSSKAMKKAAEIGSALIVCTNGAVGVDEVVNHKVSKPFTLIVFGVVLVCGIIIGGKTCAED